MNFKPLTQYSFFHKSNCYLKNNYKFYSGYFKQGSMTQRVFDKAIWRIKREEYKEKMKVSPSTVYLQVLGAGADGTPSSLYVSSDHIKYIFNCGEGTQRLAHEHHLKLTRLENMFFTTPTWENMGGLMGMALTIQDAGVSDIKVHGPKGIGNVFQAVKQFVMLHNLNISDRSCEDNDFYEDACMRVNYVRLQKSTSEPITSDDSEVEYLPIDNTDYYAHETNNRKRLSKKSVKKRIKLPKTEETYKEHIIKTKITGCVAYICKLTMKTGTLNIDKCIEKRVPAGPWLGKLKNGEDVTLDDGTVIKSSDVVDKSIPGPAFIVLECPDEDYLDSLVNNEKFVSYQLGGEYAERTRYVIHFSPDTIMTNPRYIAWMNTFSPHVEHLVINKNNKCISYAALHKIQHQLNIIHPTIFPILHDHFNDNENKNQMETFNEMIFGKLKIHRAKMLDSIHLRPPDGLNSEFEVKINRTLDVNEVMNKDGFLDHLAELQTEINAKSKLITNSPNFPKITILGTGSSAPNKARNTSAILLQIDESTSIVMDCGEGTMGQIIRFFGPKVDDILASIKSIYVSHLHADHHLGLIGILQRRKKVTNEPVFLIAPKQIESWLRFYDRIFEPIDDCFLLVPNHSLLPIVKNKLSTEAVNELHSKLKIQDVGTIEVEHCPFSYGVAWTMMNGKKIVYSGDTIPCDSMIALGKDCDLLIHEATMEDGLEDHAKNKRHSTISQAIDVGIKMNANFIFLTHFSQRYKIPRLPDDNLENVGYAFDNMQFNLAELSLLPLFNPCLKSLFSDFVSELEFRALKRHKPELVIN